LHDAFTVFSGANIAVHLCVETLSGQPLVAIHAVELVNVCHVHPPVQPGWNFFAVFFRRVFCYEFPAACHAVLRPKTLERIHQQLSKSLPAKVVNAEVGPDFWAEDFTHGGFVGRLCNLFFPTLNGGDNVNTVNYIAFTNYADALPLTETDRRWWIVFTPFATLAEVAAAIGPGPFRKVLKDYFDKLHSVIQQYPAELRCWLLNHKIDADFQPNGSAPMTDEKTVMIGMSVSDDERTVREILERGAPGISRTLFASSYLSSEAFTTDNEINLATSALSRLLIKMGYTRLPKKLKWRNKTEIIWVLGHKEVKPEDARFLLDKTLNAEGSQCDDLF